jgi:hypothetical protein
LKASKGQLHTWDTAIQAFRICLPFLVDLPFFGCRLVGFLTRLLGPNVVGGHYSVIFVEEAQVSTLLLCPEDVSHPLLLLHEKIKHSLQLIKPILEGKIQAIEVTDEATDSYNEWIQKRLTKTVYADCDSYYFEHVEKDGGKEVKGKNSASFPGPATLFYWLNRRPQWQRFRISGAKPGWRPPGARTLELALLAVSVLVAAMLHAFL